MDEKTARAWAEQKVKDAMGKPRPSRGPGPASYKLLVGVGVALVILGFALPALARTLRVLALPALVAGGFAVGFAIARLDR